MDPFFVESQSYKVVLVIMDGSGSSKALVIMDESKSLEVARVLFCFGTLA